MTTTTLDPQEKEAWLEALRSGRYTQGRGELRTLDGEHCCLGVLCDVRDPNAWVEHDDGLSTAGWRRSTVGWGRNDYYLNDCVPDASFGITEDEMTKLVEMNDNGATFAEIADYIEEHL